MSKLRQFFNAVYQDTNWDNYPITDEYYVCMTSERKDGINKFLTEYEEWETNGFPNLDEYLTPTNGKVRHKA